MALLSTRRAAPALALAALALAACDESPTFGHVELRLYDEAVTCSAALDDCSPTGTQETAVPQFPTGSAYVSRNGSRFAPDGLYMFFEFSRTDGALAMLEVDLPLGSKAAANGPYVSYKEYRADRLVFASARVRGRVALPAHLLGDQAAYCNCTDGRLELDITSAGPDGALGTEDDGRRRVSRARYRLGETSCRGANVMDIVTQGVEVTALTDCPTATTDNSGAGTHVSGGGYYETDEAGCEPDPEYEESEGCEGDTDDEYYEDDVGCGGDTTDDDYGSDEYGCEGDTTSDEFGDSGCEGDTSDSSSSCEGDAYAAVTADARRRPRRRRSSIVARAWSLAMPVGLLAFLHCAVRRRRRRGRRPGGKQRAQPLQRAGTDASHAHQLRHGAERPVGAPAGDDPPRQRRSDPRQ